VLRVPKGLNREVKEKGVVLFNLSPLISEIAQPKEHAQGQDSSDL